MSDLQDKRVWKVMYDAYREMYNKATPKADFDEMIKTGEAKKEGFFYNYHLPKKVLDEIIEKHLKGSNLRKKKVYLFQARPMRNGLYLGSSPCTCEGDNPDHFKKIQERKK